MTTVTHREASLEDLLCFDLYAASRAVTAAYRPLLAELDLTYPQYLVLVVLAEERSRTVKDLAAALRLDHGTLTPLLKRMQDAGLVTRTRSADDERVVDVALTAAGERACARLDEVKCGIQERMGITAARARDLQQALRSLVASVEG